MTIGEIIKKKRNEYRIEIYNKIMDALCSNITLNEACNKCGISCNKYYYICKIINKDTTKQKQKQNGGYTELSLVNISGQEILNSSFSETDNLCIKDIKKSNNKQINKLYIDDNNCIPKKLEINVSDKHNKKKYGEANKLLDVILERRNNNKLIL